MATTASCSAARSPTTQCRRRTTSRASSSASARYQRDQTRSASGGCRLTGGLPPIAGAIVDALHTERHRHHAAGDPRNRVERRCAARRPRRPSARHALPGASGRPAKATATRPNPPTTRTHDDAVHGVSPRPRRRPRRGHPRARAAGAPTRHGPVRARACLAAGARCRGQRLRQMMLIEGGTRPACAMVADDPFERAQVVCAHRHPSLSAGRPTGRPTCRRCERARAT